MNESKFWEFVGAMINLSLKDCKDCPVKYLSDKENKCNISCGESLKLFYNKYVYKNT